MNDSKSIRHSLKFERTLHDNDYGLIISETGNLKGIWVPDHLWADPFPHSIVTICLENYGINPNHCESTQGAAQQLH